MVFDIIITANPITLTLTPSPQWITSWHAPNCFNCLKINTCIKEKIKWFYKNNYTDNNNNNNNNKHQQSNYYSQL